jgi:hypothetical protein
MRALANHYLAAALHPANQIELVAQELAKLGALTGVRGVFDFQRIELRDEAICFVRTCVACKHSKLLIASIDRSNHAFSSSHALETGISGTHWEQRQQLADRP